MPNILVDTSSWINFFSGRHPSQADAVRTLLEEGRAVINGLILAELLQGFRKAEERRLMEEKLRVLPSLILTDDDCAEAGHLSARLRSKGQTTSLVDILIAQSAVRHGLALLHYDSDFRRIAKAIPLKCHDLSL